MSKTQDTICFALIVTAVNMCIVAQSFSLSGPELFWSIFKKSKEGITTQAEFKVMASVRPLKYFRSLNPPLDLTVEILRTSFILLLLHHLHCFSEISWLYLNILAPGQGN